MAHDGDDRSNAEEVGHGHPPKQHRIKPGEIRNPWGRKGKPGSKKDFLDESIEMRVDGVPVRVSRDEAIDHALFNALLKGGKVSAAQELQRRRLARARSASNDTKSSALPSEDQAALDRYVQRRMQELPGFVDPALDQNARERRQGSLHPSARR